MKNLKSKMTKPPFDYANMMRGFNAQLYMMQSRIYEFIWELSFKNRFGFLNGRLKEQFLDLQEDASFFLNSRDPWVIHAVHLREIFSVFQHKLESYFGIDAKEDVNLREIFDDSELYAPYRLDAYEELRSGTYRHLQSYYKRTAIALVKYVCYMAKVFEREDELLSKRVLRSFKMTDEYLTSFLDLNDHMDAFFFDFIKSLIPYLQMLERGAIELEPDLNPEYANVNVVLVAEARYATLADYENEAAYLRAMGLERVEGNVCKLADQPEVGTDPVLIAEKGMSLRKLNLEV